MYGSESWALRKKDQNQIDALEMWIWRRILKISWRDHITNEDVKRRVNITRTLKDTLIEKNSDWTSHSRKQLHI